MDYNSISNILVNRVGFREPFNSKAYPSIHPDLLQNEGLLVHSVSERWLTPEMLSDTLEHFEGMDIDAWDNMTNYVVGSKVKKVINNKNFIFVALQDNVGIDPEGNNTDWESALSFRLREYRDSTAKEVVKGLSSLRNLKTYTSGLKEADSLMYVNTKGKQATKRDLQRGVRLKSSCEQGVKLKIPKIGVYCDTAQDITFYLHHSDNTEPQTYTVTIGANDINRFVWKELLDTNSNPIEINYRGSNNVGGEYYLTFFEEDLTGNYKVWDLSYAGYYFTRNRGILQGNYFNAYPVEFTQSRQNKPNLPDIGEYLDGYSYNYELPFNLMYEASEDPTQVIIDHIDFLDELYQTKLAFKLLQSMLHSNRINDEGDLSRGLLNNLLYGSKEDNNFGLEGYLKKLLKLTIDNFSNILKDKRGAYYA